MEKVLWQRSPQNWNRQAELRLGQESEARRQQGGFAFPLGPGPSGRFEFVAPEVALKQQLQLLLGTAKGERLMRPDYGCRVHDLLFHPNNPGTRGRLVHAVEEAIELWEDRVRELQVAVVEGGERAAKVELEIRYSAHLSEESESIRYGVELEI